jgi:hypothetical protein
VNDTVGGGLAAVALGIFLFHLATLTLVLATTTPVPAA